jgi:hypothetical protein
MVAERTGWLTTPRHGGRRALPATPDRQTATLWPKSTTNVGASFQPTVQTFNRDQWLPDIEGQAIKAQRPAANKTLRAA